MSLFSSVTVAWLLSVKLSDFSGWWESGLSSSMFSPSPGCTPSLPPVNTRAQTHTAGADWEETSLSLNFLWGLWELTSLFRSASFGYCWGHFTLPCWRLTPADGAGAQSSGEDGKQDHLSMDYVEPGLSWGAVQFGALQFWSKSLDCPYLPWATWVTLLEEAKPEAVLGIQSKFPLVPGGTKPGCSCDALQHQTVKHHQGAPNHQSSPDPLKWFVAVQSPGFHLTLGAFRLFAVLLLPCCCTFILVQNPFLALFFSLLPQNYGTSRAVQLRSLLQIAWGDLWIGLCHQPGCTLDPLTIMKDNLGLSCFSFYKGEGQMFR